MYVKCVCWREEKTKEKIKIKQPILIVDDWYPFGFQKPVTTVSLVVRAWWAIINNIRAVNYLQNYSKNDRYLLKLVLQR
jgi:hypothetical protein